VKFSLLRVSEGFFTKTVLLQKIELQSVKNEAYQAKDLEDSGSFRTHYGADWFLDRAEHRDERFAWIVST